MTRVLVTGGRDYDDPNSVFSTMWTLHAEHDFSLLIHGACPDQIRMGLTFESVDMMCERWAIAAEVNYMGNPAKWKLHGVKRAGPIRNSEMIKWWSPDFAVIFPGGRGTKDCFDKIKRAKIPFHEVKP